MNVFLFMYMEKKKKKRYRSVNSQDVFSAGKGGES